MSRWAEFEDEGHMSLPNPMDEASGYTIRNGNSYASGMAPMDTPPGTIWNEELQTYIDEDVAETLFRSDGPSNDPYMGERDGQPFSHDTQHDEREMGDDELAELQAQIEAEQEDRASGNETLDAITEEYGADTVDDALNILVNSAEVESTEDTLANMAEALGSDPATMSSMIYTAVAEATPAAEEVIGSGCWNSLLHASSLGGDREARAIVAGFTSGHVPAEAMPELYRKWYRSLPDAEG
ncbi:hypothetical protein JYP49_06440 [Nitratireductor aquimarinus]|uniref:hypothetical protein n=2 Tax=Alphaproteobacteria TaxID=28211 RepID=UPI0019D32270|nr:MULTISPECIES: hypothetical protein [Nitratireductor]MBN7776886.1 hypothetical protein [Nitratireductor pacificus]MBN7780220.1 hypothetical protein [Nitratireductor pacificus]MBN7789027.1 hypothetical protein [Nitratireductor aquimarinus]MBY6099095.1 hypothetical protein [Nitratireductor aquimarinus]MCA1261377.1 hypothetical protein [Nitratireductor aquimarinus]